MSEGLHMKNVTQDAKFAFNTKTTQKVSHVIGMGKLSFYAYRSLDMHY